MIRDGDKRIIQQSGQNPVIEFLQVIPAHPEPEQPGSIRHCPEGLQHLDLPLLHAAEIRPVENIVSGSSFQHHRDHARNRNPGKLSGGIQHLIDIQRKAHLCMADSDHSAFNCVRFILIFTGFPFRQLIKLIKHRAGKRLLGRNRQGDRFPPVSGFVVELFIHVLQFRHPALDKNHPGSGFRNEGLLREVNLFRFGQSQFFAFFKGCQHFPKIPQNQHFSTLSSHLE